MLTFIDKDEIYSERKFDEVSVQRQHVLNIQGSLEISIKVLYLRKTF